jgi:hypothetical protein
VTFPLEASMPPDFANELYLEIPAIDVARSPEF